MAYSDFNLLRIETQFGVESRLEGLFAAPPVEVPGWLRDWLARTARMSLSSEKARSELIVMPVLVACRDLSGGAVAIFSGPRLDVSPDLGLQGECDFLLSRATATPEVRAPLLAVVEAKRHDIDAGLGQCVAQMIGARLLNERSGGPIDPVFGCVTTGEIWQFLRLSGPVAAIDDRRYFLDDLGGILGVLVAIVGDGVRA